MYTFVHHWCTTLSDEIICPEGCVCAKEDDIYKHDFKVRSCDRERSNRSNAGAASHWAAGILKQKISEILLENGWSCLVVVKTGWLVISRIDMLFTEVALTAQMRMLATAALTFWLTPWNSAWYCNHLPGLLCSQQMQYNTSSAASNQPKYVEREWNRRHTITMRPLTAYSIIIGCLRCR